ncbi:MAG: haloacid dehalogenase, partial [Acidobacteriota bacterium]
MTDFSRYEALTFDCYGTLIDWRAGLLEAVYAVESMARRLLDETRFLSDRETAENLLEAGDYRPYREVVAGSVA